ncbi:MAG: SDR family NAD(P)-dependent oxidoreductase [Acidobacteriota bacterium]
MFHLNGQKALVTGGSRGIGRACALMLAQAGADVAINYYQNRDAALEVKSKIEQGSTDCLILQADLSQKEQTESMVGQIKESWGKLDILINNAGIWTYGEMGCMDYQVWRETIKINLDSVFLITNSVVPMMKKAHRGCIVNISSTAAVRGEAFHSHYASSKGALVSLTKSLAVELAPYKIRVNCVAPGWVETDMCSDVFKDESYKSQIRDSIPLKRIPPPEDIAGPVVFLVSDYARHITGEVLNVNGGAVLCG